MTSTSVVVDKATKHFKTSNQKTLRKFVVNAARRKPLSKSFTALRDIEPGEEITVNYNGKPKSRSAVWFEVVEATATTRANGLSNAKD